MAVTVNVPVASIIVGDRRREEYGAVDELAESIKTYGLLHPIIVDIERNLVAGGRRLAAIKALGWRDVPVRMLDTLTPAELREVELEENLQRKDLTSYELSKELIEDAKAMGERILSTNLVDKPLPRGHQPTYGVPKAEVAKALATSTSDLVRAEQHVAAVEQHPILKDEPQSTAIDYAKAVRQEPTLMGSPIARTVEHYRSGLAKQREQVALLPETPAQKEKRLLAIVGDDEGTIARARLVEAFSRAVLKSYDLTSLPPDRLITVLDEEHLDAARDTIRRLREWCDGFEKVYPRGPYAVREGIGG